jgi:ABC-type bacteriocin/lantibiotic exporter with double-glycine peptidase domain
MGEKMENNVKDIKYYLKKSFPFIIAIFMSAIIVALSQVSIALSMKYALEMLLSEKYNEIIYLLIIFLAIILISGLGYYLLGVSGAKFKKSFLFSLKKDCTDQILKMSMRDFSQHSIGEISSTITNDVNKFDTQYLDTIIKIILQTTTFIFSSAVLFYYNPLLALSIYIFAAIMVFLPRKSYQQMGLLGNQTFL